MEISLSLQGPNPQEQFPATGSCAATSEAAPALHGEVGSGCPADSRVLRVYVPASLPKDPTHTHSQRDLQMLQYRAVSGGEQISKYPAS